MQAVIALDAGTRLSSVATDRGVVMETAWQRLRAAELNERAAAGALVLLPVASTEQHGPHMATGTDCWLVGEVCDRAAAKLTGLGQPVVVCPGRLGRARPAPYGVRRQLHAQPCDLPGAAARSRPIDQARRFPAAGDRQWPWRQHDGIERDERRAHPVARHHRRHHDLFPARRSGASRRSSRTSRACSTPARPRPR